MHPAKIIVVLNISIHAPLRERLLNSSVRKRVLRFQSTLPCGSDQQVVASQIDAAHFNPRSLAGATEEKSYSRFLGKFQSTLPCGSDAY